MWKWWQKPEPEPEPIKPPEEFVLEADNYTVYISATAVQIDHNPEYKLLFAQETNIYKQILQIDRVLVLEKLYTNLRDQYMHNASSPENKRCSQAEYHSIGMKSIEDSFYIETGVYYTKDGEQLQIILSRKEESTILVFSDPKGLKYTPVTLEVKKYLLSISPREITLPGWTLESAIFDTQPEHVVDTDRDGTNLTLDVRTTDIDTILDKLYHTQVRPYSGNINKRTSSIIDNGQRLYIEIGIYIHEVKLVFTKNPQTLAAASAQRLLEGIERVLNA
jgi:hypothetical protein